jgi:diguanylate cyclase (GGDEF)-like protein/PAS domain S-box-containing protein
VSERDGMHCIDAEIMRLSRLESEMEKNRIQLEHMVAERTEDLIRANKRLQLEMVERDLIEEQSARKAQVLDAINQILQQALGDHSERALSHTCLRVAQELTHSPFGFVVERDEGQWQVMAAGVRSASGTVRLLPVVEKPLEINGLWQKLVNTGATIQMRGPFNWDAMPEIFPEIITLLAVAFPIFTGLPGFIALANNAHGYCAVDQADVQALMQVYVEALMRKRSEKARYLSEKRLNLALESADEGLWDYYPRKAEIYYSPRWFNMLGYHASDLPYHFETWKTLTHPEEVPALQGTFEKVLKGAEAAFGIEIRMLAQSGQWRWMQVRGRTAEWDQDGQVARIVGTLIDISKYKRVELALQKANEELQRLAALDALTQIANRRRFDERLAEEWRRARRDATSLALIICDIDYFKPYNDTYGHVQGDATLNAVAQAISGVLKRSMDLVARYGGEEFALVLPNTDLPGALRVAGEVKKAIEALRIEHRASAAAPCVSLSYGVAVQVPRNDLTPGSLLEKADHALYQAKSKGRNRIAHFDRAWLSLLRNRGTDDHKPLASSDKKYI